MKGRLKDNLEFVVREMNSIRGYDVRPLSLRFAFASRLDRCAPLRFASSLTECAVNGLQWV